jgi:hypothetical protein
LGMDGGLLHHQCKSKEELEEELTSSSKSTKAKKSSKRS